MNKLEVLEFLRELILVAMKVSAPVLVSALVVGVLVSLIQAVTQIQEATLSFIPKALSVGIVLLLFLPLMLEQLEGLSRKIFERILQMT